MNVLNNNNNNNNKCVSCLHINSLTSTTDHSINNCVITYFNVLSVYFCIKACWMTSHSSFAYAGQSRTMICSQWNLIFKITMNMNVHQWTVVLKKNIAQLDFSLDNWMFSWKCLYWCLLVKSSKKIYSTFIVVGSSWFPVWMSNYWRISNLLTISNFWLAVFDHIIKEIFFNST